MEFYGAHRVYEMKINARELSRSIIFFSNTRIVPGEKRIFDWTGDEISSMFVNGIFNESSRRERITDRKWTIRYSDRVTDSLMKLFYVSFAVEL